jgi:2-dehydropantoate 2-reductase
LVSPHGDVTLHPPLVLAGEIAANYDVVLLTVKAFGLEAAMDDFAPAVGKETVITPLLNGMRHLDVLRGRFASELLGGVCLVATATGDDGKIVQMGPGQALIYGELSGEITPRAEKLDGALKGAGFEARLSENIVLEMWEKWIFLASVGCITCLMRGNIGEVEAVPGGPEFARRVVEECSAISIAAGYQPRPEFLQRTLAMATTAGSGLTTSMYRDLSVGRPIEADHIVGDLLERARKAGLETPLLDCAWAHLSVYQNRLARK